jgi:hypothetical protein
MKTFTSITPEAREFAASEESQKFTLANAVLIDSLAKRLVFNFFLRINKPPTPTRGFTSRISAEQWFNKLLLEESFTQG